MRTARVTAMGLAAFWIAAGAAFGRPQSGELGGKPTEVFQGEIVELKVSGAGLAAVEGRMGKETIHFYPGEGGTYAALVGVDLAAQAGVAKVFVKGTTRAGAYREIQIPIKIKTKVFPKESFSVATEFDPLSPEALERIRREQEQLSRVFATSVPGRLWEGPFSPPVAGETTSPFGFSRVINGTPRAPHTGVDLKAPAGTEVLAANHGRVVLLGDFFFSGKSLILDHGGGLFTMYFHLSEAKVGEGMQVRKGDVVALSGMTGRVTGPHLHWGARINGARVNPFELVEKLGARSEKPPGGKATIQGLAK